MKVIRDKTQEAKILKLLLEARGGWVAAPELAKISLQYCRAIAMLRRTGLQILNRVEHRGKTRHGFYRLVGAASMTPVNQKPPALFSEPMRAWNGDL